MHCPHCNHDPCRASTPQCDPLRPLLDFGLDVARPYAEFLAQLLAEGRISQAEADAVTQRAGAQHDRITARARRNLE